MTLKKKPFEQKKNGKSGEMLITSISSFSHTVFYLVRNKFCPFSYLLPFPKRQILGSSRLKEYADNNFKFDENGRKFAKRVENTVGKGEIACYEQFFLSLSVFKRLVLQTRKNQGLFRKGLIYRLQMFSIWTRLEFYNFVKS